MRDLCVGYIYDIFVIYCILPANAGACLSPEGELAQEHLRIRQIQ